MDQARRELGPIDILVNNAGMDHGIPLEEITPTEGDQLMAVNSRGVHNCCLALVDEMKARRAGKIVCTSSMAAVQGSLVGNAAYAASKAGFHGFAMTLARLLAPYGINVNTIAPGPIETEMFQRNLTEETSQHLIQSIPLGMIGQPEDIANAAVFLVSEWSRYITGVILNVNGGLFID
jgi:3-oxoacyl-[acyl-carrier protein] reductase